MPPQALVSSTPEPWIDPNPSRPILLWNALKQDIIAHVIPSDRPQSRRAWIVSAIMICIRSSGFHLTVLYRLSHTLRARFGLPGRIASALLFWVGRHLYGCSIASTARIHGGLILPHPQGIVIGGGTEVGPRAFIFQNVTLGGAPNRTGMPRIGQNARLYTGAVLSGPIQVGDCVQVGANAVLAQDVPASSFVRSAPVSIKPIPPTSPETPPPS